MVTRLAAASLVLAAAAVIALPSGAPAQGGGGGDPVVFLRISDPPGEFPNPSKVMRLDPATGKVSTLAAPGTTIFDLDPAPDGKSIAYTVFGEKSDSIRVVQSNGKGDRELVTPRGRALNGIAQTTDGSRVIFAAAVIDGQELEPRSSELYSVKANGKGLRRLTDDRRDDLHPTVTPDGKSVVFARSSTFKKGQTAGFDLYSMEVGGGKLTQITDTPKDEFEPDVSPDGQRIAHVVLLAKPPKQRRRSFNVTIVDTDGTNPTVVESGKGTDFAPRFSPDGESLIFYSDRADKKKNGGYFRDQLYTAAADGTGVERLLKSRFGDIYPAYLP